MARELPFPQSRDNLQVFKLLVLAPGHDDDAMLDSAMARGMLLSPRRDRDARDQEFLVLRGSLVRKTQGVSDQPTAIAAREKLRARDALEDIGGAFDRLTCDVAFPSVSRAANLLCGRAENGWYVWWLDNKATPWSLSEAYDRDMHGEFELLYYEAPTSVIRIPR